jgi:hypothetical protein
MSITEKQRQQQAELQKNLWSIADDLRGNMVNRLCLCFNTFNCFSLIPICPINRCRSMEGKVI